MQNSEDAADTIAETFLIAWRRLDEIPAGDREILALEGWEGLGPGEIATVLGCSRNAARIRLHRAHRRLAQKLADQHAAPNTTDVHAIPPVSAVAEAPAAAQILQDDDYGRIRDNYRQNYGRLVRVKRAYDPDNLFHVNQNVAP